MQPVREYLFFFFFFSFGEAKAVVGRVKIGNGRKKGGFLTF